MACSSPIPAFQLEDGAVVMVERGRVQRSLFLPCGRCAMCRLERARQWAVRCVHESKLYDHNAFVTLTYDDRHLPIDRGLRYRDFQLFMKRLRKRFFFAPIRFYMCGEYGEDRDERGRVTGRLGRPHYHALLFNCHFPDQLYFKRSGDITLYTSRILSELWPEGNHLIGSVTFQSAGYCARYCMEKINGPDAKRHYEIVDSVTGEVYDRAPEFSRMSLKPGIGAGWLKRFQSDVYPRGEVLINGHHAKAPRYYDILFERNGGDTGEMSYLRYKRSSEQAFDNTDERLLVKEQVAVARLDRLIRSL
uniref:Replication protein VP4 n=1 Tax=Gokushovirinae environmental samples TaxID=1478972 RepID=A0A2R3UAS8_9VIRU|nr:replication protein VP4 [Gokushovirinae environmental samples]